MAGQGYSALAALVVAYCCTIQLIHAENINPGARITEVYPRFGSNGGGTIVTLRGANLGVSAFALQAGGSNAKLQVQMLRVGLVKTDLYPEACSDTQITFITRPSSRSGEHTFYVTLGDKAIPADAYCADCNFQFVDERTPVIRNILPQVQSLGNTITLEGKIFTTITDARDPSFLPENGITLKIQRIYVGGDICDMYNDEDNERYGIELVDPTGYEGRVTCEIKSRNVGCSGDAVIVMEEYGNSVLETPLKFISATGQMCSVQVTADIHNIDINTGSIAGGTLITLTGTNLDASTRKHPLQVYVGDSPAEVVKNKEEGLVILTPPLDPAAPQYAAYAGARGVVVEIGPGFRRSNDPTLHVQETLIAEDFSHKISNNLGIGRMYSYYIPPVTDQYVFYPDGFTMAIYLSYNHDDPTDELTSRDPNAKVVMVETEEVIQKIVVGETPRSEPVTLIGGQKYYLEAYFRGNNGGVARVAIRRTKSPVNHKKFEDAVDEKQQITVTAPVRTHQQTLDFSRFRGRGDAEPMIVTFTMLNSERSTFSICASQACTGPLFNDIDVQTLKSALQSLETVASTQMAVSKRRHVYTVQFKGNLGSYLDVSCTGQCEAVVTQEGTPDGNTVILGIGDRISPALPRDASAEDVANAIISAQSKPCSSLLTNTEDTHYSNVFNSETSENNELRWSTGQEATNPFCGSRVSADPSVFFRYVEGVNRPIAALNYKFLCFAYIGSYRASIKITFQTSVNGQQQSTNMPVEWDREEGWHYTCLNFNEHLRNKYPREANFLITLITAFVNGNVGGASLDAVSVRKQSILTDGEDGEIAVTEATLKASGSSPAYRLESLEVEKTGDGQFYIEAKTADCAAMDTVVVKNDRHETTSADVIQEGSRPITGTFDMIWDGHMINNVPAGITDEGLEQYWSSNVTDGRISVQKTGDCYGAVYDITFIDHPGAQELIEVESNLEGNGVEIRSERIEAGGVLMNPIRGDTTAMVYAERQIRAIVNGIPTRCEGATCTFTYSEDATPLVTFISASEGRTGDSVDITMTGFDSEDLGNNLVYIGESKCRVTDVLRDGSGFKFRVGAAPIGTFPVTVRVLGKGNARMTEPFTFTVEPYADDFNPRNGGRGGGLVLTVTGSGFNEETTVDIGGKACTVQTVEAGEITCILPPLSSGKKTVTVNIGGTDYAIRRKFVVKNSAVPLIDSVSTTHVQAEGGTVITVEGRNFGDVWLTSSPTRIGDVTAGKLRHTNTLVEIISPPLPQGEHEILLFIEGQGYAITRDGERPTLRVDFEVHAITPDKCSAYGGCYLTITGVGLDMESPENYHIHIGRDQCDVTEDSVVSDTELTCFLGSTSKKHYITNSAIDRTYGEGFKWDPPLLEIEANDEVQWQWEAPPHITAARYGVHEVDAPGQDYNGGFQNSAGRSAKGVFSKKFVHEGSYHFTSTKCLPMNDFQFYGQIRVVPKEAEFDRLSVDINGISAIMNPGAGRSRRSAGSCEFPSSCQALASPDGSLGISMLPCLGGIIDAVDPLYGTTASSIGFFGSNILTDPSCVQVEFGDYTCNLEGDIEGGTGDEQSFTCNVDTTPDDLPPMEAHQHYPIAVSQGSYGYALLNQEDRQRRHFYLRVAVFDVQPREGSVAGGTYITVTGEGFVPGETEVSVDGYDCVISDVTYTSITCKTTSRPSEGSGVVEAIVNDKSSVCENTSEDACNFNARLDITPRFTDFYPPIIRAAGTMVLSGEGFGDVIDDIEVKLDGAPCEVTSVTDTEIQCYAPSAPGGQRRTATIWKDNIGYALGEPLYNVMLKELTAEPLTGSVEGGTLITLTGIGFIPGDTEVRIGDTLCHIEETDYARAVCRTEPNLEGEYTLYVRVRNGQFGETYQYTYASINTPQVMSIEPTEGPSGTPVTITGVGFSSPSTVTIGGVECIQEGSSAVTDTTIECTTGNHVAGMADVDVWVASLGTAQSAEFYKYSFTIDSVTPNTGSHGGNMLITLVGGGLGDNMHVTVCGQTCSHLEGSPTQATCLLPLSGYISGRRECIVSARVGTEVDTGLFTYDSELTPSVEDVTPRRGGTGGGTDITITGLNFGFEESDVHVSIAHEPCTLISLADTQIICDTGARAESITSNVLVYREGYGGSVAAFEGADKWQYANVWSSMFTWGPNFIMPSDGEMVVVPRGQSLVVDIDTPLIKMLLIQGGETTFDNKDITLRAENILITNGGKLQIGTPDEPFIHRAVIEMYGRLRAPEVPIYGAKALAVREGTLDMHGLPAEPTWTLLAATALPGSDQIVVQAAVNWNVGSQIAIATTGDLNSQRENEVRTIVDIGDDRQTLTLDEPLEYGHLGITERYGDTVLEMRAEVALLSRNILFVGKGDPTWEEEIEACPDGFNPAQSATQTCSQGRFGAEMGSDQYGAHIMTHNPDFNSQKAVVRLSYVELNYVGQAFRISRYPIHFHLNGDSSESFVHGCSVHKGFNRAINIHNSHNIRISQNVIYDIMGGAVFLEDSIEHGNILDGNFVGFVKSSRSLLTDDITPSGMWITHPNNIVINNHVAGGTHFGFWYRMLEHPEGPSFTTDICPQNELLGLFHNNTVHSVGWYGLWIMETYIPKENGACGSANTPAVFESLTAWNSLRGAEAVICGAVHFKDFVVANNDAAGIEWLHLSGVALGQFKPAQGAVVENAVIIAHTEYQGHPGCTKRGLVLPFESGLLIDGVKFYNFDGEQNDGFTCSGIGLVKIGCQCSQLCGAFRYEFQNTEWHNSIHKAHFEWEHMMLLVDRDGTLVNGRPNSKVLPASGSYDPQVCQVDPEWGGDIPGAVCGPEVAFTRFAFNRYTPHDGLHGLNLHVTTEHGTSVVPHHTKGVTHRDGWFMLLQTGIMNKLRFPDAPAVAEIEYTAGVYDLEREDYVLIGHETPRPITFNTMWLFNELTLPTSRPLTPASPSGSWHYSDEGDGTYLYSYIVSDQLRTKEHTSRIWTYTLAGSSCLDPNDCTDIVPSVDDAEEIPEDLVIHVQWDDVDAWNSGSHSLHWETQDGETPQTLPQEGGRVVIPEGFQVQIYDQSPPMLESLMVLGELTFRNDPDKSFEITTKYLYVSGAVTAGDEGHEFEGQLTFNLIGDINDEDFPIVDPPYSDGVEMGVKAIGVYGDLKLFGKKHNYVWVDLAETSEAGSNILDLEQAVDWQAGDEVLITPTSYEKRESEVRTIESVEEEGRVLVLSEELEHRHISGEETLPSGETYSIKAKVGLLTRNIRIMSPESSDDDMFGGRVVVGIHTKEVVDQPGFYQSYMGTASLSNVEFARTGQFGLTENTDPRFSLSFVSSMDHAGHVEDCSFHHGYSTHIGLFECQYVNVTGNVLHGSMKTALEAQGQHTIEGNLIAHCRAGTNDPTSVCVDLRAIDVNSVFRNNVIAGAQRVAIMYPGEVCPDYEGYNAYGWDNNAIIASHYGIVFYKHTCGYEEGRYCTLLRGWTVARISTYGMYYSDACNLQISNNTFIDNTIGSLSFVAKPSLLEHEYDENKEMLFSNNLLVGHSPWMDCSVDKVRMNSEDMLETGSGNPFVFHREQEGRFEYGYGKSGFVVPTFSHKPVLAPGKTWTLTKCYPALLGRTLFIGNTAVHYGEGCAGAMDKVIVSNPNSLDVQHPVYSSGFTNINVPRAALYHLGQPNPAFITAGYCGDMECDAQKKLMIKDMDGSLTGRTGSATIIPESDRAWDTPGMRNRGVGDFRIPSVMQTDLEGNRIEIDEVRPHTGIHRPADAEFVGEWPGYIVQGTEYVLAVFESLDHHEFLTRRPGPMVIRSRGEGGGYVDVINGPRNYQLCEGYPCNFRPAVYYALVAVGEHYDVFYTSDPPANLRIFLANAATRDWVGFNIYFANRMRMDVYVNDVYKLPLNARESGDNILYTAPPANDPNYFYELYRLCGARSGIHIYDQESHTLSITAKGPAPLEIRQTEVTMVEFGYEMMEENDVFNENMVLHLATLLGVPLSRIRVVNAVSENSRRRRATEDAEDDSNRLILTIELGDSPPRTAPHQTYQDLSGETDNGGTASAGGEQGRREAKKSLQILDEWVKSEEFKQRLKALNITFLGITKATVGTEGETSLTEVELQSVDQCDGQAHMSCEPGHMLRVDRSRWGNTDDQGTCKSDSASRLVHVTCDYHQNCTLDVNSDFMGDSPCEQNCFSAEYDCVPSQFVVLGDDIDIHSEGDTVLDEEESAVVIVEGGCGYEQEEGTGTVIGWKILVHSTREVHLQLWEPVGDSYSYLGGTIFQPRTTGYHTVHLENDDVIEGVPKGAVIGVMWTDGASIARYPQDCSTAGGRHILRYDNPTTPIAGVPLDFTRLEECGTYAVQAIITP